MPQTGLGRVRQIPSLCGVGGETGYTAQEDLKSVNSYDMGEGRTICVCFFVPAFQDPFWFYLLFSTWVTTFLPSFIFRANSLAPVHTLFMSNCLPIFLFRHLGLQSQGKGGNDRSGFFRLYRGSRGVLGFLCLLSVRVHLQQEMRVYGMIR